MLFGCPEGAKITIFRGPHVRLIFDQQARLFTRKWPPKFRKMGVYFNTFFDAALEPCLHDVVSKIDSKMVPNNLPFLRPLTLLQVQ